MPTLPTFTAQIGGPPAIGGRASGADFAGPGLSNLAKTVAAAGEKLLASQEDKESREALIASSEIRTKYNAALDEAALSGEDTELLKERMRDELSILGDGFETARGRDSLALYSTNAELMFDEQANRIRVQRAASEARLAGMRFLNAASELLQQNPFYLKTVEFEADAFAETLRDVSPEDRKEIAAKLKKELSVFAVNSFIRINPSGTKSRLETGEWDLTPDERSMLMDRADQGINAQRIEADRQKKLQLELLEAEREKTRNGFLAKFTTGELTTDDILTSNLEAFGEGSKDTFLDMIRVRNESPAKIPFNPATITELFRRIHLPDGDPKKIVDEKELLKHFGRGLNDHWLTMLRDEIQGQNTQQGADEAEMRKALINTAKGALTSSDELLRISDPYGDQQYLSWLSQFITGYKEGRAAGKSAASLLTPGSQDYLGKTIQNFYVPPVERMKRAAEIIRGYKPPPPPISDTGAVLRKDVPAGAIIRQNDMTGEQIFFDSKSGQWRKIK